MRSTVLRRSTFLSALLGALVLAAVAVAASNTTVTTHNTSKGKILSNSRGFSLYMFAKDKQGSGGKAPKITCYGQCAKIWPPLLVSKNGKVVAGNGSSVNQHLLGTARRRDGKVQATYNGWPLYLYVPDTKPGQTHGEGAVQFGAAWYLLNTKGQLVKHGTNCPPGYQMTPSGCLPQNY